jgi:hypothetical protein
MEAFSTQLLTHVLDSISLFASMGQLTAEAAYTARSALGNTAGVQPESKAAPAAPAAFPSKVQSRVMAVWDYGAEGGPDDLVFAAGDTVIVDEESQRPVVPQTRDSKAQGDASSPPGVVPE